MSVEYCEFVQRYVDDQPEPSPEPVKINPSENVPFYRKPKEKNNGK